VVQAGESFWSIATVVADSRAPGGATLEQIDVVWRGLIDANREQLPKPSNPSLLYVGMTLTIPP
jgi:nucleoid-associated protein YgaU